MTHRLQNQRRVLYPDSVLQSKGWKLEVISSANSFNYDESVDPFVLGSCPIQQQFSLDKVEGLLLMTQ